jgi:hypothetical protein
LLNISNYFKEIDQLIDSNFQTAVSITTSTTTVLLSTTTSSTSSTTTTTTITTTTATTTTTTTTSSTSTTTTTTTTIVTPFDPELYTLSLFNNNANKHNFLVYDSSLALSRIYSMTILTTSTNVSYIYYIDNFNFYVVKSHLDGTYIKHITISNSRYITAAEGDLYVTSAFGINRLDENLNIIKYVRSCDLSPCIGSSQGISYDKVSGLLYVVDGTDSIIQVFNKNVERVDRYSIGLTSPFLQFALVFDGTIYIGSSLNSIIVVKNKAVTTTYSTVCKGGYNGYIYNLIINSKGNMFVPCNSDKKVYLYNIDGTYLNQFITFVETPIPIVIDPLGRMIGGLRTSFPGLEIIS